MDFIQSVTKIINTVPLSREAALEPLRGKKCYIYGAGIVGITLQSDLAEEGIQIAAFLDDNPNLARMPKGFSVLAPDDATIQKEQSSNSCVIITFRLLNKERRDLLHTRLRMLGFASIYYYMPFLKHQYNPDIIKENTQKILDAASLFRDKESQDIFLGFLSCATIRNMETFPAPTPKEQYHPDLPFAKGLAKVIDCGAYDGDTAIDYGIRAAGKMQEIALFEPDMSMYAHMTQNLAKNPRDWRYFAFPCGVYDKNTSLLFNAVDGGGSTVSETGESLIQCVRIDDALAGFKPTCIKMDVEGSEYAALQGASSTIETCSPDLSICAYHKLEDIWELPLLIKSIQPSYSCFLRSHYMYGLETVLYCISNMKKEL